MRFPGKTVPAEKEINLSPGFSRFGEDFGLYRKPKKRIIKTMVRRVRALEEGIEDGEEQIW